MDNSKVENLCQECLTRVLKLCPDLFNNHEILDSYFDEEGAFVVKSQLTNDYGTQVHFTRLFFKHP